MIKKGVFISFFLILGQVLCSQDIHFSQFYSNPIIFNPATSGQLEFDYRANVNYKSQWSAIGNAYKTIAFNTDFVPFRKKNNSGFLGTALSVYSDKAGKSKLGTTLASLSVAYHLKLNDNNFLAAGLQFGYVQKSIDIDGLKWDNQFDGTDYNSNLPTGENFYGQRKKYFDFGAGINWGLVASNKNKLNIGIAITHVGKPNQSFNSLQSDYLKPNIVFGGDSEIKFENNVTLSPVWNFQFQGKLFELNSGLLLKYGLGMDSKYTGINKSSYVTFGCIYRYRDAAIVVLNYDYLGVYSIGFSYDFNVSRLSYATNGRGGVELSLVYKGLYKNKVKIKT
ncbi:MAG: PorP/SprF family type IX secretion system membrane protein [Bacteroidetes bacterium]|nr:PorP/SprF family type IX secretion system membrane protein [Bacteroidota bacterium]